MFRLRVLAMEKIGTGLAAGGGKTINKIKSRDVLRWQHGIVVFVTCSNNNIFRGK